MLIYGLNFLLSKRCDIFCYRPFLVFYNNRLIFLNASKKFLCITEFTTASGICFQLLPADATTKQPITHTIFLQRRIQVNFRLFSVKWFMKNNVFKLGRLHFHAGHVHVYAYMCYSTLSNFVMINGKSAVLLLDAKYMKLKKKNHRSY